MRILFIGWPRRRPSAGAGRILAVLALVAVLALGGYYENMRLRSTSATLAGRTVVLDAGHGGVDSGAVGNGILEKHVVLAIVQDLARKLRAAGIRVILTRDADVHLVDPNAPGRWVRKELDARVALANRSGADAFLSIHANSYPSPHWSGGQVFIDSHASPGSKQLALDIQGALRQLTATNRTVNTGINHYLLKQVKLPAVVTVEVGFVSHPGEAALLGNPAYQKKLSYAIFLGIVRYFSGKELL